jgi:hypothetical protein
VFHHDSQIVYFLNNLKELSENQINWQGETENEELEIEDLPNNSIPKGVVPLERIFDRHDMYKGKLVIDKFEEAFEINIGSTSSPRMIKIGKKTTPDERRNIENTICEYKDVFAWSYDDLKAYK